MRSTITSVALHCQALSVNIAGRRLGEGCGFQLRSVHSNHGLPSYTRYERISCTGMTPGRDEQHDIGSEICVHEGISGIHARYAFHPIYMRSASYHRSLVPVATYQPRSSKNLPTLINSERSVDVRRCSDPPLHSDVDGETLTLPLPLVER